MEFKGTIAKKIILEELEEQGHPVSVENVIFWALEYYCEHKKGTHGSAVAYYIKDRILEEEALGKEADNE